MENTNTEMKWNIESEYPSIHSDLFKKDFERTKKAAEEIKLRVDKLRPQLRSPEGSPQIRQEIEKIMALNHEVSILLWNIDVYLHCLVSINSKDGEASTKLATVEVLRSEATQYFSPLSLWIRKCSNQEFQELMKIESLQQYSFLWEQDRKRAPYMLSDAEEILLEALSVPGHKAWGSLYDKIGSTMKCELKFPEGTKVMGLATTHAHTRSSHEETRKIAWHAIQNGWKENQESSAAILNSLASWRLEIDKKRAHTKPVHFLDVALHSEHISHKTLEALLKACEINAPKMQEGCLLMAQLMNKKQLDPWDLLAPCPVSSKQDQIPYEEAMDLIYKSFADVDTNFAGFAKLMQKKQWIEGRSLPTKAIGGYCTGFAKSKEPRVFMTYLGSKNDIRTLAHEIGHAYHSWVMRDLPKWKTLYSSSLAETASIFAESVMRDVLLTKSNTLEEKVDSLWNEVEAGASFLLNIPFRFDLEKTLYERRQDHYLEPEELSQISEDSWKKWYGNSFSQSDRMFWAHKMHFSMSRKMFYNFPYTFGYLFALSIYARRQALGSKFMTSYVNILRDTGQMMAEDLVRKHLNEDIETVEFWQKSIDVVLAKVDSFRETLKLYRAH
ncbi:MAG: M3 family metallopeptidase [Pseudobdellovibrionaceae bacterium]